MVIAVEHGLEHISTQLKERGYTIVSYPEYGGVVDAFIYKEDMSSQIEEYYNSSQIDSLENHTSTNPHGILIINANNKSIEAIEKILKKRVYSPLF